MALLRETRSKIDPRLLNAMKDHLSAVISSQQQPPHTHDSASKESGEVPATSPQPELKKPSPKDPVTPVYPLRNFDSEEKAALKESEPVDRQKIAQIVLQYMKHREENGSKH